MIPYSDFSGNTTAMNELSEILMVILIFLVILMTAFRLKFFKNKGSNGWWRQENIDEIFKITKPIF